MYACIHDGQVAMRMRSPLVLPAPRREPSYSNVLPPALAGNRLNSLQFEALLDAARVLPKPAPVVPARTGMRELLKSFVPLMVQKFPRAG